MIIGQSIATQHLIKTIHHLAGMCKDILIVGESGVGKGTVAKSIFELCRSKGEPTQFLLLNLSVLDERELDALLFADRSGNVTTAKKRGVVENVHRRFVLIEEIEKGSLLNQMKVLKFINECKLKKSSDTKKVSADIRLIVTMKENPDELVRKKELFEELRRKFKDFEMIFIPPLRERRDDIPPLVKHFKNTLCEDLGLQDIAVDTNSIEVLLHQPWCGNIRELKSVVERGVLYSKGGRFALPPELIDEKTEVIKMLDNIESGQEFVLDHSLDVVERGVIERTLKRFGFNQYRTATFLGMTEQTLRYKLKRLGIPTSRERRA